MKIDIVNFREVPYGTHNIYFDRKYIFHEHFGHKRKTKQFPFHKNILLFLANNPNVKIFFTLDESISQFEKVEEGFLVNINAYTQYCNLIGNSTQGRIQAFLGQNISLKDISFTEDQKNEFIVSNATETNILEAISTLNKESKKKVLEVLSNSEKNSQIDKSMSEISTEEFMAFFSKILRNPDKQQELVNNYSQIQIAILEEHKKFLEDNLDKDETFIQNWIDGKIDNNGNIIQLSEDEIKKSKRSRCLIFGLEFIDHKREGSTSSKRFDVLTRMAEGHSEYVLIELKSPSSNIFKIVPKENDNGGISTEYHFSYDTSRSIPQISEYRSLLEDATDVDWQRLGLIKGKVAKCIILIGTRKSSDLIWEKHFLDLRKNLSSSIEILTYTDLINKLKTTITNLKENL